MVHLPEDEEEPPQVRLLRRMVMVLIVVLILGFVLIVATIVIRLGFPDQTPEPVAAERLAVPEGYQIVASGQGRGTVHLVVRDADGDEVLLVYDAGTGAELSRTELTRD